MPAPGSSCLHLRLHPHPACRLAPGCPARPATQSSSCLPAQPAHLLEEVVPKSLEGQLLGQRQVTQPHLLPLPSLVHLEKDLQGVESRRGGSRQQAAERPGGQHQRQSVQHRAAGPTGQDPQQLPLQAPAGMRD